MIGSFASAVEAWFQTEYWPKSEPWYDGAIWGNLFVVPIAVVLGSLFWPPLRKRLHRFVDAKIAPLHSHLEETHRKLDHIIEHHPDIPPLPPKRVS